MQFPKILMGHCHLDVKLVNGSIISAQIFGRHYLLKNAM